MSIIRLFRFSERFIGNLCGETASCQKTERFLSAFARVRLAGESRGFAGKGARRRFQFGHDIPVLFFRKGFLDEFGINAFGAEFLNRFAFASSPRVDCGGEVFRVMLVIQETVPRTLLNDLADFCCGVFFGIEFLFEFRRGIGAEPRSRIAYSIAVFFCAILFSFLIPAAFRQQADALCQARPRTQKEVGIDIGDDLIFPHRFEFGPRQALFEIFHLLL